MNKLKIYKLLKWIFLGLAITTYIVTTLILIFDSTTNVIIILYTIGSIFLLIFATLYILQIKLEEYIKNPRIKKQKEKKIKSIEKSKPLEINQTQQVIQEEKLTKQKVKLETPNNKATKKKDNLKTIYYIFLVLSIINLVIGLILLNIPLLYMLVIPTILTFFALSIVCYLIAKSIKNKIDFNTIINVIKNQNRE